MSEPVYTSGDVARLTGVNFRTVIRWIERGDLQGYKLPGRGDHRVTKSNLLAFLDKYEMPIPTEMISEKPVALIVDDDEKMGAAISRIFHKLGWDTRIATNGFEAGVEVGLSHPKVMILDLKMPFMNGFKVLKFTREKLAMSSLKIIVISGQGINELNIAIDHGADAALEKPFDNQDLIQLIISWFPTN